MRASVLVAIVACASILGGCGGNAASDDDASEVDASSSGGLLIGQDCPDACIPRCVFEALSRIGACMPAGDSVLYGGLRCYENGIVEQGGCSGFSHERNFHHADGSDCLRWRGGFETNEMSCYGGAHDPSNDPRYLEVRDGARTLLVEGRADEADPDLWTFTCEGRVRTVDLTANATNAECAGCPADFVRLPIPMPPLPTLGDDTCRVPGT